MAHLHFQTQTFIWTQTQIPVLYRSIEWGSESESVQCEHVLQCNHQIWNLNPSL